MFLSTIIFQAIAASAAAVFITWSIFRQNEYASPNNKWLPALKKLPRPINMGIRVFIIFGAMFAIADGIWAIEPYIHRIFFRTLNALGLQWIEIVVGVLVIICGLYAYWFKNKYLLYYGIVEVIFAGAAGVVTAKQLATSAQIAGPIATLIGSVYVVSRGVSNIADGLEKKTA